MGTDSQRTLSDPRQDRYSTPSGDAEDISLVVNAPEDLPRGRAVLIIDPPRKGTDENFIGQTEFGCGVAVYVSREVHSQGEDIGMTLEKDKGCVD